MKRILACLLLLALMLPLYAPALAEETLTSGPWSYTVDADGNATVTHYGGADAVVSVPAAIEGHPVIRVASPEEWDDDVVRELHLPEGLVEIGYHFIGAFWNLEKLWIPTTCTTIYADVFQRNAHLREVFVPWQHRSFRFNINADFYKRGEYPVIHLLPGMTAEEYAAAPQEQLSGMQQEGERLVRWWNDFAKVSSVPVMMTRERFEQFCENADRRTARQLRGAYSVLDPNMEWNAQTIAEVCPSLAGQEVYKLRAGSANELERIAGWWEAAGYTVEDLVADMSLVNPALLITHEMTWQVFDAEIDGLHYLSVTLCPGEPIPEGQLPAVIW